MFAKNLRFFPSARQVAFIPTLLKTKPIADMLTSIYNHSFNQQLFDATLDPLIFGRYLRDDYFYLHAYALALNKLSSRTIDTHFSLARHLTDISTNIISGEQDMQYQYSNYFIITPESRPGPAISAYIDFITKEAATAEIPVALCGILPCFLIYHTLGSRKLCPKQLLHNPYKQWIKTYSNPGFIAAATTLTHTVNTLAEQSSANVQSKMEAAFKQGVKSELEFFNEVQATPADNRVTKLTL